MKNFICTLLIFSCAIMHAQYFKLTPDGIKDAHSPGKNYIIQNHSGESAITLYKKAKRYLIDKAASVGYIITKDETGKQLLWRTTIIGMFRINTNGGYEEFNLSYTTSLSFNANQIVYKIQDIDMGNRKNGYDCIIKGNSLKAYAIYNENNDLRLPETKSALENYFNEQVNNIDSYIRETVTGSSGSGNVCDKVTKSVDKFNDNEISYYTQRHKPVSYIRTKGKLWMSFRATTPRKFNEAKGVYILFEDGSKISKPDEVIEYEDAPNGDYVATALILLEGKDLEKMKETKITDYRLYIHDTELTDFDKQQELLHCILDK